MREKTMREGEIKKKRLFDIVGNETAPQKLDPWWWLVAIVVAMVVYLTFAYPDPYQEMFIFFLDGVGISIFVTLISFILVLFIGLLGGLGRLSKNPLVHGITTIYVEIVRGIPLLVQLMFWYFAFPSVLQKVGASMNIEAFQNYRANPVGRAIMGSVYSYAAYMNEISLTVSQSTPKGKMETARSLVMRQIQALR
ncbi:MAG: ABC transporter permease subunit, partial [Anaerolineaceae bacterium]|nr:ABC transporter permease subunit [Anaerolineaceae bacterium]